jgi:hypothetical protein
VAFLASSTLKNSIKTVARRAKAARKGKRKTGDSRNWSFGAKK